MANIKTNIVAGANSLSRKSKEKKMQNEIDSLLNSSGSVDLSTLLPLLDKRYISKILEDTSYVPINFKNKVQLSNLNTKNARKGNITGVGAILSTDSSGAATLELDNLIVRRAVSFNEVLIQQMTHTGGIDGTSAANIEITDFYVLHRDLEDTSFPHDIIDYINHSIIDEEEKYTSVIRCSFEPKSGVNNFIVGDIVLCQSLNYTPDFSTLETNYYRRRVLGVGANYIDLELNGITIVGSIGSNVANGDNCVQWGHLWDRMRQSIVEINTIEGGRQTFFREMGDCRGVLTESRREVAYSDMTEAEKQAIWGSDDWYNDLGKNMIDIGYVYTDIFGSPSEYRNMISIKGDFAALDDTKEWGLIVDNKKKEVRLACQKFLINDGLKSYNEQWFSQTDTNVDTAIATAEAAELAAQVALESVENFSDDSILTVLEKTELEKDIDAIKVEYPQIIEQATLYNVNGVPLTDYQAKYTQLISYISNYYTVNVRYEDSEINRSTFNNNFEMYYSTRQALLNAITEATKAYTDAVPTFGAQMLNGTDFKTNLGAWESIPEIESVSSGYESLIFNGDGAYLNTGLTPVLDANHINETEIEVEFTPDDVLSRPTKIYSVLFSARAVLTTGSVLYDGFLYIDASNNKSLSCYSSYSNSNQGITPTGEFVDSDFWNKKHTSKVIGSQYTELDGVKKIMPTSPTTVVKNDLFKPILIGVFQDNSGSGLPTTISNTWYVGAIHKITIRNAMQGNIIISEITFIPDYRDGQAGLYSAEYDLFLTNQGAGTLNVENPIKSDKIFVTPKYNDQLQQYIDLKQGETYTLSGKLKSDEGESVLIYADGTGIHEFTPPAYNEFVDFKTSFVFNRVNGNILFELLGEAGNCSFLGSTLKLEKGEKSSAWGLSDADLGIAIDEAKYYAQVLIDSGMVTAGGLMVANADGIVQAGMIGEEGGKAVGDSNIRAWFGADYENRATAPTIIDSLGNLTTNNAILRNGCSVGDFSITGGGLNYSKDAGSIIMSLGDMPDITTFRQVLFDVPDIESSNVYGKKSDEFGDLNIPAVSTYYLVPVIQQNKTLFCEFKCTFDFDYRDGLMNIRDVTQMIKDIYIDVYLTSNLYGELLPANTLIETIPLKGYPYIDEGLDIKEGYDWMQELYIAPTGSNKHFQMRVKGEVERGVWIERSKIQEYVAQTGTYPVLALRMRMYNGNGNLVAINQPQDWSGWTLPPPNQEFVFRSYKITGTNNGTSLFKNGSIFNYNESYIYANNDNIELCSGTNKILLTGTGVKMDLGDGVYRTLTRLSNGYLQLN